MGMTYFKRFRMEIDLGQAMPKPAELPPGYELISWRPDLLEAHAETKYQSFRTEIDANVFPCLGDREGCLRLMREISRKEGFLPVSTWLARYQGPTMREAEYCGTVQGICDRQGQGAIQNLGITAEHRGRRIGSRLLHAALEGFQRAGLRHAYLEVTAHNAGAIRLYQRVGFRKVRTVYKAAELAYT